MRSSRIVGIGIVCALMVSLGGDACAIESGARIGNWFYNCVPNAKTQRDACFLSQTVEGSRGKQTIPVLTTNVGYLFGDGRLWMVVLLPLETWNLALQEPLTIGVDQNPILEAKADTCFTSGCRGRFLLDDNIVTALKLGKAANLSFRNVNGKKVTVEISLTGFTKALTTLK